MAKRAGRPARGPYLATAFVCEKALHEKDDVMTYVRVVDQIFMVPNVAETLEHDAVVPLGYWLVISFKSGTFRGKRNFKIELTGPSGRSYVFIQGEAEFFNPLPESGHLALIAMHIKWDGLGHYRFDVFLEDRHVTSVPVNLCLRQDAPTGKTKNKKRRERHLPLPKDGDYHQ